jgi:hypothetical protein
MGSTRNPEECESAKREYPDFGFSPISRFRDKEMLRLKRKVLLLGRVSGGSPAGMMQVMGLFPHNTHLCLQQLLS